MPVLTSLPVTVFDQEAFHAVDKMVTGVAFEIHNEFGRYLDERLYQAEMASRLSARGLTVAREVRVTLSLEGFVQHYLVDLLVNGGVIVETKTASTLTSAHRAQVLNYLYLCGLHHATLLNFRTQRVQHEFVSTMLTPEIRLRSQWDLEHWQPQGGSCEALRGALERAIAEWGTRLDPALYRDTITHFLGGESSVIREIEIRSSGGPLGLQKVHVTPDNVAFSVTASIHRPRSVLDHHQRFLSHTSLRALHWINLSGPTITLHTLKNPISI